MSFAIGVPQYGTKKKNNFRLKDGSNVYRILPPLGTLAAEGIWAVYDSIHWGYKGSKGAKPFKCIQKKDFKTKMVKVQCPECDKIEEYKARLEDEKRRLEAAGKKPDEISEYLKPLSDWLYNHNLDKKWYLNVINKDGQIGKLAIPHKMFQQLQELCTELVERGVDPIAVDGGVEFDFSRSGKGRDTIHRVKVVEVSEMINGTRMSRPKPAPLTQADLQRLATEAWDLKNSIRVLNYDEIKQIVSSGGDEDIVDSVFGSGEIVKDDEPEHDTATTFTPTLAASSLPSATPDVQATTVVQAVETKVVTGVKPQSSAQAEVEALMAQLEALKAKAAAEAQAQAAATSAVSTPAKTEVKVDPTTMSDDEFLGQFGFKK